MAALLSSNLGAPVYHGLPKTLSSSSSDTNPPSNIAKETLLDIINDNHELYHIEYQDHLPNVLAPALLCSYDLGASQEQLRQTYHRLAPDLERLRLPETRITPDNWADFFGQKRYYRDYLVFFDAQIAVHTALSTFQTYFPRLLPGCIGSSLHPLVHLALGLDFGHPHVISEGLAYACIAYSPIGEMVDAQCGSKPTRASDVDPSEILDMVKVDKRFDGGFDGAFGAKLKMLAKSRGALVKVYMDEWNVDAATTSDAIAEKLHSLARLSTLLFAAASTHTTAPSTPTASPLSTSPTMPHFLGTSPPCSPRSTTSLLSRPKLDIHIAALFSSLYAVNTILPLLPTHTDKIRLLKLQWLATLCIYIVQGRPTIREEMLPEGIDIAPEYSTWEKCIRIIVEGNDPHAPVIIRSLLKAEWKYGQRGANEIYLRAASVLAEFVDRKGDWDHKGAGW